MKQLPILKSNFVLSYVPGLNLNQVVAFYTCTFALYTPTFAFYTSTFASYTLTFAFYTFTFASCTPSVIDNIVSALAIIYKKGKWCSEWMVSVVEVLWRANVIEGVVTKLLWQRS